jgi:hypothetical protein
MQENIFRLTLNVRFAVGLCSRSKYVWVYEMALVICFRKYCIAACDVEEPEVKFNIDQYTDVTMITKPVIYISIQEIVDTHQVLLNN